MSQTKHPRSLELQKKIVHALHQGPLPSSGIGRLVGISAQLARYHTGLLVKSGLIELHERTLRGRIATNLWRLAETPQASEFTWPADLQLHVAKPVPPGMLTRWVGGNPYERLAA